MLFSVYAVTFHFWHINTLVHTKLAEFQLLKDLTNQHKQKQTEMKKFPQT